MKGKQISKRWVILATIIILFYHCLLSKGQELTGTSEVYQDDFATGTGSDSTGTDNYYSTTEDPYDGEGESLPHIPNVNTTRCGEVFRSPSSGIFYSPFEPVLSNERCVWMIFVEDAVGFEVAMQYFGYEPRADYGLVVTEIRKGRRPTHFIPTDTNTTTIENCNLVMVTFYTGEATFGQSGFVLQYKALTNGTLVPPVSPSSQHYLISSNEYFHKYPDTGNYKMNELSTFAFTPENNIYHEDRTNAIVYMRVGLYSCTYEFLKVYFFNSSMVGEDKWEFQGRICGAEPVRELMRSAEPILIVFESGSITPQQGFQFTYTTGL